TTTRSRWWACEVTPRGLGGDIPGQTRRIDLPKTIADVDARWLTEALGVADPGIAVSEARVLKSLGGACTKPRVALTTNRPEFPKTVIVKGCLESHSGSMRPMQLREIDTYTRIVPLMSGIQTVKCYFAQRDEEVGGVLILEDLDARGARCLRAVE